MHCRNTNGQWSRTLIHKLIYLIFFTIILSSCSSLPTKELSALEKCALYYDSKTDPNFFKNRKPFTFSEKEEIFSACRSAATSGNAISQNLMGVIYENGFIGFPNPQIALSWYLKAAQQNEPNGLSNYNRLKAKLAPPPIVKKPTVITPEPRHDEKIEVSSNMVTKTLNAISPDLDEIYKDANESWYEATWIGKNATKAGLAGTGSASIPFAHLPAMLADFGYLLNRMSTVSLGIGAIQEKEAGCGNQLEYEDFYGILGIWGTTENTDTLIKDIKTKVQAISAAHTGGVAGADTLNKILAKKGILVGKKLGTKASSKIAAKFASKFAIKAGGGFVPIAGAVISGGVNVYFVNDIADAAQDYYSVRTLLCR